MLEITFQVLIRDRVTFNTETLYEGTKEQCQIFVQGYQKCLEQRTSYIMTADTLHTGTKFFHSPLVSQSDLAIWITMV